MQQGKCFKEGHCANDCNQKKRYFKDESKRKTDSPEESNFISVKIKENEEEETATTFVAQRNGADFVHLCEDDWLDYDPEEREAYKESHGSFKCDETHDMVQY